MFYFYTNIISMFPEQNPKKEAYDNHHHCFSQIWSFAGPGPSSFVLIQLSIRTPPTLFNRVSEPFHPLKTYTTTSLLEPKFRW